MKRVRRWVRRGALVGALASAAVLVASLVAAPASANQPDRTGWWGAPDPNTPKGGLHIAVAPQQLLAYGAVAISLPSDGTGTLELKLAGSAGSGTLQACPTKQDNWQAGDGQPMSSAPGFDCSVHAYQGLASSDNKTLTFLLDGSTETTPGTLSVAIVPVQTTAAPGAGTDTGTDMTPPYNVEIAAPDASSFTQTGGSSSTGGSLAPPPPPPPPSTQSSTASSAGGVPATGAVNLPPGGSASATTPTAPDAGTAPVVAGQNGTTPTNRIAPVAQNSSTDNNKARNAALALLALLFLALVTGGTPAQRAPRRIGRGGAHRAPPAPVSAAAGVAAAPTQALMAQLLTSRGLGRFAKPRMGPPRPLT